MKVNRFIQQAAVAAFAFSLAGAMCVPAQALNVRFRTVGTFVDRAGGQHPWTINDAHTLVWESQPYIPVGGVFVSKYTGDPTDANYQADVSALEALKAKDITDIVLKMGKPITSCDPAAVQKLIDYLDTNGFLYGVEFDDGPREPLSGYVVSPNRYRLEGPSDSANLSFDWPGVDSAMFAVVGKFDGSVREQGGAIIRAGKVTIKLDQPLSTSSVLIVYPHKTLETGPNAMGDLWSEFGEYRDRMLAFFKQVKFGTGLRFFSEPFTSKMDFNGDLANLVPDSSGFRLGFEGYLLRKYTHEGSINSAWGMKDQIPSAEKAARLVPMWSSGRGLPYLYDRASAQFYGLDVTSSSYWRDMLEYRDMSTQEYMNTVADTLRKTIANVPVIFESSNFHRIYANPFGMGGYDGLGVQAYGTGDAPVIRSGGGVYALAEESAKCTWFVVTGTQAAAPGSANPLYSSESSMTSSLDSFREVGCKGFYVDGLQTDSGQADWLKSFKEKIKPAALTDYKPTVISYPVVPATGGYVKRLAPDTWWLPTLRVGKPKDIGDGLCAYSIAGEDRIYIWSNTGPRTITLKPTSPVPPVTDYAPKGALADNKKRGAYALSLTDSPVVLRGLEFDTFLPVEVAEKSIAKLMEAIPAAEKAGTDVHKAKMGLENAKSVLIKGQAAISYGMAQSELDELLKVLGTDTWIEGEDAAANNFDGALSVPGASKALALVLDTSEKAPLAPYSATYSFESKDNTSYEIWIAGTPPSEGSPATFSVDDVSWSPVTAVDDKIDSYAPGLAWYKIGTTNAFAGKHNLRIKIEGPRQQDNRYYFAIDAVVLSPKGFKPNGIIRP